MSPQARTFSPENEIHPSFYANIELFQKILKHLGYIIGLRGKGKGKNPKVVVL